MIIPFYMKNQNDEERILYLINTDELLTFENIVYEMLKNHPEAHNNFFLRLDGIEYRIS